MGRELERDVRHGAATSTDAPKSSMVGAGPLSLYFASRSLFKNTDTPVFKVCLQVWNPPGPSLASLGPSVPLSSRVGSSGSTRPFVGLVGSLGTCLVVLPGPPTTLSPLSSRIALLQPSGEPSHSVVVPPRRSGWRATSVIPAAAHFQDGQRRGVIARATPASAARKGPISH